MSGYTLPAELIRKKVVRRIISSLRILPSRLLKHARSRPCCFVGELILLLMVLIALMAPLIAPYDPSEMFIPYQPPSQEHLLGTNDIGNDILSELIYGTRVSLSVGILAAVISVSIGTFVGMLAGYRRGWIEQTLMGITDVFLLIPALPLMIVLAAYMEPSMWNVIIVIGLLWWCPTARIVHSRVLQVREMGFIESARAMGFSTPYVLFWHVLPNTAEVILAKFGLTVAIAMLTEASLSFLGLGDPLNVSWGTMISFAFSRGGVTNGMYWWYLPPGFMISIAVLGFIMISMDRDRDVGFFRWI